MKVLIGIINCHTRPEYQQIIRNTWLPTVKGKVDVKFFLGQSDRSPLEDEVFLDVDDSYQGLPQKVQAMVRWAFEHGYTHVMKLDDDCMVLVEEWLKSNFELYDFVGGTVPTDPPEIMPVPYGFAYVLSRKAMEIVMQAQLPPDNNDERWVTIMLHERGITLHSDQRYFMHMGVRVDPVRGPAHRPLRNFNRPTERQPMAGTFVLCIYLNWFGFHTTPLEVILQEYQKVWERTQLCH